LGLTLLVAAAVVSELLTEPEFADVQLFTYRFFGVLGAATGTVAGAVVFGMLAVGILRKYAPDPLKVVLYTAVIAVGTFIIVRHVKAEHPYAD
jgi:predicted lysophospholipase L1 biosynthesis ABC-type transport system permease subunit